MLNNMQMAYRLSDSMDNVQDENKYYYLNEEVENNIVFSASSNEMLRLEPNGDIYIQGRLAENDKEVVDALRLFLQGQGML